MIIIIPVHAKHLAALKKIKKKHILQFFLSTELNCPSPIKSHWAQPNSYYSQKPMGSLFSSHKYEVLLLDVDGTLELGTPYTFEAIQKNLELPPKGRPFAYNARLLSAIRDFIQSSSRPCHVYLFTAYRAQGAKFIENVLRVELVEEMRKTYGIEVVDVVTLLDPAYAQGIGRYYKDVIAPAELALLRSGRHVLENADVCELGDGELVQYEEIQRRELGLFEKHGRIFGTHAHKGIMMKYCVDCSPELFKDARITFLDDREDVIQDVVGAIEDLGFSSRFRSFLLDKTASELKTSEYLHMLKTLRCKG